MLLPMSLTLTHVSSPCPYPFHQTLYSVQVHITLLQSICSISHSSSPPSVITGGSGIGSLPRASDVHGSTMLTCTTSWIFIPCVNFNRTACVPTSSVIAYGPSLL